MFESLFNKVAAPRALFLWNLRNIKEHLFWKTSTNGCFYQYYPVIDVDALARWLFQKSLLYISEVYWEHCQASMRELFRECSQWLIAVNVCRQLLYNKCLRQSFISAYSQLQNWSWTAIHGFSIHMMINVWYFFLWMKTALYVNGAFKVSGIWQCDCNGIRTHNHLVCKRTLKHLSKLANLASLVSDICPVLRKVFLDIEASIDCRFTLKRVRYKNI